MTFSRVEVVTPPAPGLLGFGDNSGIPQCGKWEANREYVEGAFDNFHAAGNRQKYT